MSGTASATSARLAARKVNATCFSACDSRILRVAEHRQSSCDSGRVCLDGFHRWFALCPERRQSYRGVGAPNSANTFDAITSTCWGVIFAKTPPHADDVVLYTRSPNALPSFRSE